MQDPRSTAQPDMFDRLLEAMPRIAEAVNLFTDARVQRSAVNALIAALRVPEATRTQEAATMVETSAPDAPTTEALHVVDSTGAEWEKDEVAAAPSPTRANREPAAKTTKKKRGGRKWETVRDMDWRPEGKQSFKDLVAGKVPTNADQRNILAVYWLHEVAEVPEIGVGHVEAAFLEADWRMPAQLDNALQITASTKRWLDTSNMKDIAMTPTGRNVVRYDMPIAKEKKSA